MFSQTTVCWTHKAGLERDFFRSEMFFFGKGKDPGLLSLAESFTKAQWQRSNASRPCLLNIES